MSTEAFSPAVYPRLHGDGLTAEREKARVRGYAEGHAEGFRAGNVAAAAAHERAETERIARETDEAQAVSDAVAALHAAARSLADRERHLAAVAQSQVLAHAIELAELIVAGELSDADAAALSAVRRAMAAVDPADIRELRLHADDIRTLERLDAQPAAFVLSADETLERGDAVAMLEHGFVDARIGSALERARLAVTESDA
ncbi:FliH/SctL family protein [Microbacterium abyssi]|uniref:FliH/SctL family protein n=1 Tax=Microbacterium abyssi TaxID=2782166 RepID=UPI001887BF47|nr:FliH/SctL family protein [Microbacterium sp. A18JL241]